MLPLAHISRSVAQTVGLEPQHYSLSVLVSFSTESRALLSVAYSVSAECLMPLSVYFNFPRKLKFPLSVDLYF